MGQGGGLSSGAAGAYPDAARALVISLRDESPVDARSLHTVQRSLDRTLAQSFAGLGEADRAEIVSEVVVAVLLAVREGRVDPDGNPGAYLRKAAERRAIDHFRRAGRLGLDQDDAPDPLPDDDAVARCIDTAATAQEVDETFALLASRGQHGVAQVISRWLVLAEKLGDAPSLREAAEAAGVSHDTVSRHLDLFRQALIEVRDKRQD